MLLLLLAFFAEDAAAIGNRTHAEISERAADRWCSGPQAMVPGLAELMAVPENRKALYAGSTFPDWGFGGIDHEAAEQSHWTPFLDVFLAVLKERMQSPWSEEDQKNVAFFLGDISHSAADIPWHFDDPHNPSFLSAAKAANGCSHIDCDTGSDSFLMQRPGEGVVPNIGFGDYYWPTELLVEVYQRAGRGLPRELVRTGGVRQQGYWIISQQVSDATHPDYSARCPWIGENLDGYYYGGIDHNAAAVSNWFKHYFARLRGDFFFQDAPVYGRGGTEWAGYAGCRDTTLFAEAPTHNAGGEPLLELRPHRKSAVFLRFDIAEVPVTAGIAKATLWLAVPGALAGVPSEPGEALAVELVALESPWDEGHALTHPVDGLQGLPAAAPAATWAATRLPAAPAAAATLEQPAPGWYRLDITVQARLWAADPAANHGLALRLPGHADAPIRFCSSEAWKSQEGPTGGERVALRPALVLETAR